MSNFYGVETNPDFQPAECSWGSGDSAVNPWFLRVVNPDMQTSTLLIGEIFFKHMAQAVGYAHRSEIEEEQNRLRQELADVRATLDSLTGNLSVARESVAALAELEGPIGLMQDILAALGTVSTEDGGKPDSDDDSPADPDGEPEPSESGDDEDGQGAVPAPDKSKSGNGDESKSAKLALDSAGIGTGRASRSSK